MAADKILEIVSAPCAIYDEKVRNEHYRSKIQEVIEQEIRDYDSWALRIIRKLKVVKVDMDAGAVTVGGILDADDFKALSEFAKGGK